MNEKEKGRDSELVYGRKEVLTSSGEESVTVGELRLRGLRTCGSLRWPLEEEGVEADGVAAVAPPDAAAEVLAPSSVCCRRERGFKGLLNGKQGLKYSNIAV